MLYLPEMKRYAKSVAAGVVLLVTAGAFIYYLTQHPHTIDHLKHLPVVTLVGLVGLTIISFGCQILVMRASLHLYGKSMGQQENILFNAYSSLINFFGPGQSGPVFRGAYLKKKLDLGIKQYLFATLIYYAFFAVMSVLLIFVGEAPWWQTTILGAATTVACSIAIRWYKRHSQIKAARLDSKHIVRIGIATALQLIVQVMLYSTELHTIGAQVSIAQILSYTGVANLAMFAALTPGAIGIREAFLLFSERLHHIGSNAIVAANLVDRSVYLVFLGLLLVLVLSLHAKTKLQVAQLQSKAQKK